MGLPGNKRPPHRVYMHQWFQIRRSEPVFLANQINELQATCTQESGSSEFRAGFNPRRGFFGAATCRVPACRTFVPQDRGSQL